MAAYRHSGAIERPRLRSSDVFEQVELECLEDFVSVPRTTALRTITYIRPGCEIICAQEPVQVGITERIDIN